ncbi:MAG: diaminopimelate epimerase [Candidatus Micrarchaeota archaeon]|nr:diaminopimelate epimerase [Candidatus Micrarchaeota archaeon]
MRFTKMQGTGNDFVVINAISERLPSDLNAFARGIADRKFGVGCDQVLIIRKSDRADFRMQILNNDGSEVEMCGNGIRCLAKYVHDKGITSKTKLEVETLAGLIRPEIVGDKVKVDMGEPKLASKDWPFGKTIKKRFEVESQTFEITLVSMGNPHCVIFVPEITDRLVLETGPKIENHSVFPNRINVEFVKAINPKELQMRVWERGTGETLACGTGASAAGVAAVLNQLTERSVTVHLKGGDLQIEWGEKNVFMTGPAKFVFEGELPIK